MKHLIIYRISLSIIVFACLLIIYAMYLLFCPYNIITVKDQDNLKLDKTEVIAGETVNHYMEICKHLDYDAEVSYQIVDGIIYNLPVRVSNAPLGCSKVWIAIKVPDVLTSGEYYISAVAKYKVSAIRTITYHFKTETFTITDNN